MVIECEGLHGSFDSSGSAHRWQMVIECEGLHGSFDSSDSGTVQNKNCCSNGMYGFDLLYRHRSFNSLNSKPCSYHRGWGADTPNLLENKNN